MSSEEIKLIPDVLPEISNTGLGPWSVSKLKLLQDCPLAFYLRYLVKLKVEDTDLDENRLLTIYGKASHDILENVAKGFSLNASYVKAEAKYKYMLTDEQWGEIESNRLSIHSFWQRIEEFKIRNKVKHVRPEMKVGVTKDWKKTDFFAEDVYFRGVIDLAIELANQDALIIDHKRGPNPQWGGLRNYQFQLDSYFPLYHHGVSPIRGGQSGVNFINHGEVLLGEYQDVEEICSKTINLIEFYIDAAVDKVIEQGGFKHNRCNNCKYCDYKELCFGGKRGTSGELEKYASASTELINIKEI